MRKSTTLEIDGKEVNVTNLDKVFYPKTGFTKGDLIDYYIKISSVLLPHLYKRPISLKRYPEGVEGFFFFEKQCPAHRPKWVSTIKVDKIEGGKINYCAINDLPTLVWVGNLADLELHTFLHRYPALGRPTALVFDLDPGAPANIVQCYQVALWIKAIFDELGLECFPKTSGSKGMQLYVPLNTPVTYARTKAFAKTIAEGLEKAHPEFVVSKMKKSLRKGKVFVDWSQNDDKKTTVNVYSLRANERPTVSTPLKWEEIKKALKQKKVLSFDFKQVLARVKKWGDLFEPVLKLKQKLPPLKTLREILDIS